jgi:serine/arginine repetitive matrix protein 2
VTALKPQPPAWHDLSNPLGELNSAANRDIEEIMQQYMGLNKGDFLAIQERLIFATKV